MNAPEKTHGFVSSNPIETESEPTGNPAGSSTTPPGVTRDASVMAADIDRHHELARASAVTAVNHAEQAGKLLIEVKASMTHGEWLPWLQANVTVSPRQAQRYIAVAQGKTPTIRDLAERYDGNGACVTPALPAPKTTTVSHLPADSSAVDGDGRGRRPGPPDWIPHPKFIPEADRWCWCAGPGGQEDAGGISYVVEPSIKHPGFFFVSHLYDDGDTYDCTGRPVRGDWVQETLRQYGLNDPASAVWYAGPSAGVRIALETINSVETVEAQLAHKETIPEAIARMERANQAARAGAPA